MDYIPSSLVFPLDQTDPHDQFIPVHEYHIAGQQNNNPLLKNPLDLIKRPKASNSLAVNDHDNTPTESNKKRKIVHREMERQRRQEMSTLYRSLRSLIPLQYLKGKRSISDHMHEAVNYIKDLQSKIQELSEKGNELRRLSNSSTNSSTNESECSQNLIQEDSVTVRPCLAGVEVVVSTSFRKEIPLSQVLAILIGEGLTIVNCISTKLNERLLHNIESEVNDGRIIDPLELKQKILKLSSCPSLN